MLETNCHPKFTFLADWDVWHIDLHWSNTMMTMIRYIKNILVPYYDTQIELLGLSLEPGVALFDIFQVQQDPLFLTEIEKKNIIPVFKPASST